ncbi:MAG: class D sortase [Bryobacteraceae bacterium]
MTVRVLLRDSENLEGKRRGIRWAEYLFLFIGLIALDYYLWTSLDSTFYQAYESWSFDRQVKGRPVSFGRFLADELGIHFSSGGEATVPNPATTTLERSAIEPPASLKPFAVIGRILVPRLQLSAMVREGAGDDILRRAVGHIPSTPLPGQPGNVALAGHRDTFFRKLRDIRRSDKIVISTMRGDYSYQVESVKIVMPKDVSVLRPVAGEQALTLVTCYPFYYVGSAPKRFIVRARQIELSPQQPQTGF